MKKIQVQGVHHTTIVGSTRQSAIDFWEGVLGMPFVLEQPNLGKPDENHLYFDPGDGRLLTVFTHQERQDARRPAPREAGCVEHLAFNVSRAPPRLAGHCGASRACASISAAGARITTSSTGNTISTSGKASFTPALRAISSARWRRRVRIPSAWIRSAWAMPVPRRSVCTS